MNKMTTSLLLLLAWALTSAYAEKKPPIQKSGESELFLIRAQKGFSTLIELPPDQEILEVTCGDKEFWVIEGKGRFLHVKPAKEGIGTNLNIIVRGDIVHSFLLREITKSGGTKEKPDLKVTITGGDEIPKLRKDKENLEEALAQKEREVRHLTEKAEAERKQAQKKSEDEPAPAVQSVAPVPLPPVETKPEIRASPPIQAVAPAVTAAQATPAEEKPIATVYAFHPREGLLRTGGRALGRLFHRVSRALRIY